MADIDYNLLPVFEALFEERRVGRAALRLNVTQSAVSQALGRLRHALGDQLFLRSAEGLVPTARAMALAPLLHDTLARWRDACRPRRFEPAHSDREFRIVAGNYVGEALLPPILRSLQGHSDSVRLRVWNMSSQLGDWLENGMVDMALGSFDQLPKRISAHPLLRQPYVWIARRDHPVAFTVRSVEEALALPRLDMDSGEGPVSTSGVWQAGSIRRRAVVDYRAMLPSRTAATAQSPARFSLHQWRVALEIVGHTDLLAFVPRRLAQIGVEAHGIAIVSAIPSTFSTDLSLVWDETQTNEPSNRWLRDLIIDAVAQPDSFDGSPAPTDESPS
jgi:DNA-binding transcriptional LysR family regulator